MKIYESYPQDTKGIEISEVGDKDGHAYEMKLPNGEIHSINFQNGTIPDNGVNGYTNEGLLTIVWNRLRHLNRKFQSDYNEAAIRGIMTSLEALEARNKDRVERGVVDKDVL